MVQYNNMPLRIDGDTEHLPEVHVGRVLEEVYRGVEGNFRHVDVLRRLRTDGTDSPDHVDRGNCGGRTRRTKKTFHTGIGPGLYAPVILLSTTK